MPEMQELLVDMAFEVIMEQLGKGPASEGNSTSCDDLLCSAAVGLTGGSPLSGGIDVQLSEGVEAQASVQTKHAHDADPDPLEVEPCKKRSRQYG